MKPLACLVLLSSLRPLHAQDPAPPSASPAWQQQISGSFKNLTTASRSYFTGDAWGDNLDRLRLTWQGKYESWLRFFAEYDNELHAGNLTSLPDFAIVGGRQASTLLDLQHAFVDRRHVYWDTSLYRGYVSLRRGRATLTVGRQRIGWGTARFWSPMDVFNPISPLQVEPNERQGVDAALLEFTSPGALRWSAVYAPGKGFPQSTSALRLSRTVHNYDLDAVAARFGRDWMAGFDFAGQVRGAGLRGELTWRRRHRIPGAAPAARGDALRAVFGADYAFPNTLYLVAEYFYNRGQPALEGNSLADPSLLLRYSNEIFTLRRHFLSAGATYDLNPLWHVEAYAVTDLQGPSAAFLPSLKHSLTPNTDLSFGAQLFAAGKGGEFQGLSHLVYVELLFHFR